jgi:phosphoglycerol transferase MdoB-like AlkP superfamily enzyme
MQFHVIQWRLAEYQPRASVVSRYRPRVYLFGVIINVVTSARIVNLFFIVHVNQIPGQFIVNSEVRFYFYSCISVVDRGLLFRCVKIAVFCRRSIDGYTQ